MFLSLHVNIVAMIIAYVQDELLSENCLNIFGGASLCIVFPSYLELQLARN